MKLPTLPVSEIRTKRENVPVRGINWSDNIQDGDLAVCRNLSNRRWPYLATRNARAKVKKDASNDYSNVTAVFNWNGLVVVSGTDLLYKGVKVGDVTRGAKQFAAVNTQLVIWEDKAYLDMTNNIRPTLKPLGAKIEDITEISFPAANTGDTMTRTVEVTSNTDLNTVFRVGDGIWIEGLTTLTGNNRSFVITAITASTLTTDKDIFTVGTETPGTAGDIKLERKIPDLDYVCESGNRLWGVCNADRSIYISALGDPTNWFVASGSASDSYAVAVASEGNFTGICALSSSVLIWKERTLHKMLGDYPAEYVMYTYNIEGLKSGCERSMVIINDVLFYVGLHGVYTYAGGVPRSISGALSDRALTYAVGATDGKKYYLSTLVNNEKALLTYNPEEGVWLQEDGLRFSDATRVGRDVYLVDEDKYIQIEDTGTADPDVEWMAEYTPFFETIGGRKRLSRLMIRVELDAGSWVRVEYSPDSGAWEELDRIVRQKKDTVSVVTPPNRCDQYRVRLTGKGACAVKGMLREFITEGYQ